MARTASFLKPAGDPPVAAAAPLPLRRLVERLHARGPRPIGEVLLLALDRLAPPDRAAVLREAEALAAWSPEALRYLGADRWPRPPLRIVPGDPQ